MDLGKVSNIDTTTGICEVKVTWVIKFDSK